MKKVQIITDSCSDLGKDLREKYDIDYVKMNTIIDGEERPANLDWEEYLPNEFYDIMRNGERITTTQVPTKEFINVFTKYLNEGNDIVYIACSSKLSGSVNTAKIVAKQLKEAYPNNDIYCIDSLNSCMGEGMLAIKASEYRDGGLSAEKTTEKIMAERNTALMYCTVHSLDTLRRAGRVKGSDAFFGNLFGVKPIIISDANGDNTPIKKVKGRQKSINELVKLLKENIIDAENQIIYVSHADCVDEAKQLKELIEQNIKCKEVYVGYIGPIIGASIGPSALAVFGFGKEVKVGE